jgi:hypothetical protein
VDFYGDGESVGRGWEGGCESEDVGEGWAVDCYLFSGGSGKVETGWQGEGWSTEALIDRVWGILC